MKGNHKQQQLLIKKSRELFIRFGIKSLTMADIAKELGMSKKTIYLYVDNKRDLVKLALSNYLSEDRVQLESIVEGAKNSVDAMIQMISYFSNMLREIHPHILHDLQKYHPECWDILNDYRFVYYKGKISKNITDGITQKLYRPNIDADIISKLYVKSFETLLDQQLFPHKQYVFIDVYKEFLNYHLHGILSDKGLIILKKHNLFKNQ